MEALWDAQGTPATPGAGTRFLYPDSTPATKRWASKEEGGRVLSMPHIVNANVADVVASAANTYLTGSSLNIPQHGLQALTMFKWRLAMSKTAAGVAAPIWTIVVGVNGTTADTVRCTFTGPAQTAAIDQGVVEIMAVLRNVGAAGILAGSLYMNHNTPGTDLVAGAGLGGLSSTPVLQSTSAGFDTTTANLIVGVCVNPGASGVWTHQVVFSEMFNI